MAYSSRIEYQRKKRVQKIKHAFGVAFITVSVSVFVCAMALSLSQQASHDYTAYKTSQI